MRWDMAGMLFMVHHECIFVCQPADCGLGWFSREELIEMRGDVHVSANTAGPFVRVTPLHSHPIHLRPTPQNHACPGD